MVRMVARANTLLRNPAHSERFQPFGSNICGCPMMTVKRRSRMCRISSGKCIELIARDVDLFKLLCRYQYLRSDFLYAFLGGESYSLPVSRRTCAKTKSDLVLMPSGRQTARDPQETSRS